MVFHSQAFGFLSASNCLAGSVLLAVRAVFTWTTAAAGGTLLLLVDVVGSALTLLSGAIVMTMLEL